MNTGLQVFTFTLALAGVIIWLRWALANRRDWLYAVAPVSWLLHVVIFYAALFLFRDGTRETALLFNGWSSAVRLHAVFLMAGGGLIIAVDRRRKHGN